MSMSDTQSRGNGLGDPLGAPVDEMNVPELRGKIMRMCGTRGRWYTPLDKDTLNSLYAYLTGSFHTDKKYLHASDHPKFKPRAVIVRDVAWQVGLADEGAPGGSQEWMGPVPELPDRLYKCELLHIIDQLEEKGDQRDWMGDD